MGNAKKLWCGAAALAMCLCITPKAAAQGRCLVPVGETVGIEMPLAGVIVDGTTGDCTADLRSGDWIYAADGMPVTGGEALEALVEASGGEEMVLEIRRQNAEIEVRAKPAMTENGPVLGILCRDSMLGLGTVTYYDPTEDSFGALGHKVSEEAEALPLLPPGSIFAAEVTGVIASKPGVPGRLEATFMPDSMLGTAEINTSRGLFGTGCGGMTEGEAVEVGTESELHTGQAEILTDVLGGKARAYTAEITRVYGEVSPEGRSMLLTVTDPALLWETGGIVQGMSGSPILQDGKLVGAVSHVLVNTPEKGYGISIEKMLEAA